MRLSPTLSSTRSWSHQLIDCCDESHWRMTTACYSVTKKQNSLSKGLLSQMDMEQTSRTFHLSKYVQHSLGEPVLQKTVCCTMHRILPYSRCGYTLTGSLFRNHRGRAEKSKLGVQRSKTPAGLLTNFISASGELFKVKQCFFGGLFFYFHKLICF